MYEERSLRRPPGLPIKSSPSTRSCPSTSSSWRSRSTSCAYGLLLWRKRIQMEVSIRTIMPLCAWCWFLSAEERPLPLALIHATTSTARTPPYGPRLVGPFVWWLCLWWLRRRVLPLSTTRHRRLASSSSIHYCHSCMDISTGLRGARGDPGLLGAMTASQEGPNCLRSRRHHAGIAPESEPKLP